MENGHNSEEDIESFEQNSAESFVSIEGLTKIFGFGASKFTAVNHLTLQMHEKQVYLTNYDICQEIFKSKYRSLLCWATMVLAKVQLCTCLLV